MKLTELESVEYSRYFDSFDFSSGVNGKTFLITGSKGIVGSGVIKWLLYENQIRGTNAHIIASTRDTNVLPTYIEEKDNIEFCEFGKEKEYCVDRRIDYIIHSAAPTSNKVFQNSPVESLSVIIDGTRRMLEIAKDHKDCSMIYLSSEEAYGTPSLDEPITEKYVGGVDSLSVRSCYPLGKKVAELMCRSYFEEYGVNVKIIRPTVILGLWQPYDSVKVEAEILRCIIENKNLYMKSAGLTKKCVIYSLDAVTAVLTVLINGKAGEAYNATNPNTYCTVKDRAYRAFEHFNPKVTIEFAQVDTSVSEGYLPQRALLEDISKISELGWHALTDMEQIYEIDLQRFGKERSL